MDLGVFGDRIDRKYRIGSRSVEIGLIGWDLVSLLHYPSKPLFTRCALLDPGS